MSPKHPQAVAGTHLIRVSILCRAFQGVGGAGCFGLGAIMSFELVPDAQYAAFTAFLSVVYSLSLVLGPIRGGVINDRTTWRWIFLLNVPVAAPAIVVLFLCIPKGFPYHESSDAHHVSVRKRFARTNVARVDLVGCVALLLATLGLVAAVEEAGLSFGWRSPFVVTLLVISGILWIGFLLWERRITTNGSGTSPEPVFPWRFATSRTWVGMLM
jgi:MFS family permease